MALRNLTGLVILGTVAAIVAAVALRGGNGNGNGTTTEVPDVIGMTESEAIATIEDAGLIVGTIAVE